MKIKILKCRSVNHWYYDHIGETFTVVDTNNDREQYTVRFARNDWLISFFDCEILSVSLNETPKVGSNKQTKEVCMCPIHYRVMTHRGFHCNKCGKRF